MTRVGSDKAAMIEDNLMDDLEDMLNEPNTHVKDCASTKTADGYVKPLKVAPQFDSIDALEDLATGNTKAKGF
jgi:hypothetical protein